MQKKTIQNTTSSLLLESHHKQNNHSKVVSHILPFVLVGRTNVGKTTLFNRIVNTHKGIVSPIEHTTRDQRDGTFEWIGRYWNITDTAGNITKQFYSDSINQAAQEQTKRAISEAKAIGFVVDAQIGLLTEDRQVVRELRKYNKPIIVIVNKADNPRLRRDTEKFIQLGCGAPFAVSAVNGSGVGDLLDKITNLIEPQLEYPLPICSLTIIGKPNVGKSTLLNAIAGQERMIVNRQAHTTREPIDTYIQFRDQKIKITDTAGIRKHRKHMTPIERIGVLKTDSQLELTDVALFVIDPFSETLTKQDLHLAQELVEHRVGVIIVVNKWDILPDKKPLTINKWLNTIKATFPFLSWAPIIIISAKEHLRVDLILEEALKIHARRLKIIDHGELRQLLKNFMPTLPTQSHFSGMRSEKRRPVNLTDLRQDNSNPPRFDLVSRQKRPVPVAVIDKLEKLLRLTFDLQGTPIVINVTRR